MVASLVLLFTIIISTYGASLKNDSNFVLSLIHINDFHARYEETSELSGPCKDENCIGGFSRLFTAVNELVKSRPNPLVLNAGDNFQGTLWFNVYKWNVTQHFFNMLPTDAYTLGNHEFDNGIKGLVPFLKALNAPTVAANIDDSLEPEIQGLYNKSVVIEKYGKRIGVVGVASERTGEISSSGKLRFLAESESVNKEAERLAATENVDTIIVVSHCGYESDIIIARNAAPKISVIVGGHSHTFLYTGTPPGPDKPEGPYPTVVGQGNGRKILVVQASHASKYLGNISVEFDGDGDVVSWSGAPIYLNKSVPQDPYINEEIAEWKKGLEEKEKLVIGKTKVLLQHSCRTGECNLGNLVTDAMVHSVLNTTEKNAWTFAAIAITNSGGLRTSIPIGNISYSDVIQAMPFQNTLEVLEIQGKYLRQLLEDAAGRVNHTAGFEYNLMPVAGLKIVYNLTKPKGSRIVSVKVLCRVCSVPRYKPLNSETVYRLIVNSFLAQGGDGHKILVEKATKIKTGGVDIDVLVDYIQKQTPLINEVHGRIEIFN